MKVLIAGGTGFIGQWVIDRWLADSHQITVVTRDVDHVPKHWQQKLEVMTWDALKRVGIDFMRDFNAVINFSGANVGDKRWTASRKEELLSSRLNTSMVLASLCQQLGADSPVLINASGVGVYGTQTPVKDALPEALTEQSAICLDPDDFMASLACRWEQSMQGAIDAGVRVVCMRLGMVLGRKGGALQQMHTAVRFGMGAIMGSGNQPLAWVCIEDVRRALAFMISHGQMRGAINVVSPCAVTHKTFMHFLGKACRRPVWMCMPAWFARFIFGQMADELILNGQHVLPKKLLDAGFEFKYDDLKSALQFCLPLDKDASSNQS